MTRGQRLWRTGFWLVPLLLVGLRLAVASQADSATLKIQGLPPAVPDPVCPGTATTIKFQVSLYFLNDKQEEKPAVNVKSQSYTISAGDDSTISNVTAADFTAAIAGDKHSATLTSNGGNANASFQATVVVAFANEGAKTVSMSGTVVFNDGSTLTGSDSVKLTASSVSVTSIDVSLDRSAGASNTAYGCSFRVKIVVTGCGLDQMEIHQLIKSSTSWKDWDCTAMTTKQILAEVSADPVIIDSGGKYATDTGWDWKALSPMGGTATLSDSQLINVTNREKTIGNTIYTEVRQASTTRNFRLEVRKKGTTTILSTKDWGYTWDNDPAAWTAKDTPPNPDACCARDDKATGEFKNVAGISGLPW